jgi:hypothetical protein
MFFVLGLFLLCSGFLSLHFHSFPSGILAMIGIGGLFFLGGALALLLNRTWELQIDEKTLRWSDSHHSRHGELDVSQIKKVEVEEGDGRCLIIHKINGERLSLEGELYGNATELRDWFRSSLPNLVED